MINVEFLKTLTILYVEDDEQIREKFEMILCKLFQKVLVADDGVEGLQKFKQSNSNNDYIDIIISDINMPNMDGMELLSSIRKIDKEIPFIFTTAYTDTDFLISSIQEGVTDYFVKPVDAKAIIKKVQKTCELNQKKYEITHLQKESKKYLDVINKVAIVSIFDYNGDFTYVNDFLIEVSQYSEEELLKENSQIISHPDTSKTIFRKQWDTLKEGKTWKGKLKHLSKKGESFYVNTTIMPINNDIDENDKKYISVSFLTTKDEKEKREYKRKVFFSLQETKRINQAANDKIDDLKREISRYSKLDKIEKKLDSQKIISSKYFKELKGMETKIANTKKDYNNLLVDSKKVIRNTLDSVQKNKDEKISAQDNLETVENKVKIKKELLKRLKSQVSIQSRKIADLKDVLKHRENQVMIKSQVLS